MSNLKIGSPYVSFGIVNGVLVATAIQFNFVHPSKSQVVVCEGSSPHILLRLSDIDISMRYQPSRMSPAKEILEVIQKQLIEWATARMMNAQYEIVRGTNTRHGNQYHHAKIAWNSVPIPGFEFGNAVLHDSYFG